MKFPRFNKPPRSTALLTLLALAPAAWAGDGAAAFYDDAERFFTWAEQSYGAQLLAPVNPVSSEASGYYYRCYESGLCLGVREDERRVYFHDGATLRRLDSLDSYLGNAGKLPVRQLGILSGVLADDAAAYFDLTGQSSGRPLLLGVGAFVEENRDIIRRTFGEGMPVALFDATAADIATLRSLAGLASVRVLPDGVEKAEIYAIDSDSEGNLYDFSLLPDTEENLDSPAQQGSRLRLLADWLGQHELRSLPRSGFAEVAELVLNNFEKHVKSTESRVIRRFRTNLLSLVTTVWGLHDRRSGEDVFVVRQRGAFTQQNSSISGLAQTIVINSSVEGLEFDPALTLPVSSPASVAPVNGEVRQATSQLDWQQCGQFVGTAKNGATGASGEPPAQPIPDACVAERSSYTFEFPGGASLTHQYDRSPQSIQPLNSAGWAYGFAAPAIGNNQESCAIAALPPGKRQPFTFKPTMQWVWRVAPGVRETMPDGFPINIW